MANVVDLNADLGEGYGRWAMADDTAMLDLVTSANIACGFHAGDPRTMQRTVAAAAARGVRVGAHVAYPDLVGFGRRFMDLAADELTAAVLAQIGALHAMARAVGTRVGYVKPHGALYNTIATHESQAAAVVEALTLWGDNDLALLGLPGSAALTIAAQRGLRTQTEAFADRAYRPDGTLVGRGEPGAVLEDPDEVAARVVQMVTTGQVVAADGAVIAVSADSVCLHGDTPGAVAMARRVREELSQAGVEISAPGR